MSEANSSEIDLINKNICEFKDRCRTCLSVSDTMFSLDQFSINENVRLFDMLLECTSIQISSDERLSKILCETCVSQIDSYYEFKSRCLTVEQALISKLQENDEKPGVKDEYPKLEPEEFDYSDHNIIEDDEEESKENIVETTAPSIERKWFIRVENGFQCAFCSETSPHRFRIKTHVSKVHGHLHKFQCRYCDEIFTTNSNLKKHELIHQNELKDKIRKQANETDNSDRLKAEENIEKLSSNSYLCKICKKTKSNVTNMLNHVYFHLQIKSFQCTHCEKTFVTRSNLYRHVRAVHSVQGRKRRSPQDHHCEKCDEVFKTLRALDTHHRHAHGMRIRSNYDPVNCEYCNHRCYNNAALRKHINGIHLSKEFKCDLCTMEFRTEKALKGHRRVHGEKSGFHCKFCLFSSEVEEELGKHLEEMHPDAKKVACHLCSKEFYNDDCLKKHIKIHTAKPNHLCTICGRTFLLKSNLTIHIRTHTGEKPYSCNICQAAFSQHSSLKFHEGIHRTERSLVCNICGSKYKRKHDLRQHMKTHLDSPEFSCNLCGKTFLYRKRLQTHLRVHTDEKPFECKVCNRAFSRQSNLQVHLRLHTGERPFHCDFCGKGFIQSHGLLTHMNNHHKGVLENE